MSDPRLTPERIESALAWTGDQEGKSAATLKRLRAESDPKRYDANRVDALREMWTVFQTILALIAERRNMDAIGKQMLALDEMSVRAADAQVVTYIDRKQFAVAPDAVKGIAEHVQREARKVTDWSMYDRALRYDDNARAMAALQVENAALAEDRDKYKSWIATLCRNDTAACWCGMHVSTVDAVPQKLENFDE